MQDRDLEYGGPLMTITLSAKELRMKEKNDWGASYATKKSSANKAMGVIRPGQRVFVGSSCGEPQHLVAALAQSTDRLSDIEIVRLLSQENTLLSRIANETADETVNIRSFYLGSVQPEELASEMRFLTPINLSSAPRLFKSRMFPLNVALIQVTPPDAFGWMSLGVAVDITQAAALAADIVIAQVNARMPWIHGTGFVHVDDVDIIVEHDEELISLGPQGESDSGNMIARHVARLVDDGSTIQICLGRTPEETLLALSAKNDLGVHSPFVTDGMMRLAEMGVINNRKKGFKEGKFVASSAMGTVELYEFLNGNPSVDFQPSDYVCDPRIIASHKRVVAMNTAIAIDLTGQVAIDSFSFSHYCGVTGTHDFVKGALLAEGGKSILMLDATFGYGKKSRIVPNLAGTAVVVPRADVQYVVTEYGSVNLLGKSYQERAMNIIGVAHPDFREELFREAKAIGLLGAERVFRKNFHGIYPLRIEERIIAAGVPVTVRPAKPDDERRIQEHFYGLEKEDVFTRFFHPKTRFVRREVEQMSQIDYIGRFTLVAVTGEFGFEEVVGIGEYFLDEETNVAEVSFSVSAGFKHLGLGSVLIRKLSEAARENGIGGLSACILPDNRGMVALFKTLPFRVRSGLQDEVLLLSCRFDEPKVKKAPPPIHGRKEKIPSIRG